MSSQIHGTERVRRRTPADAHRLAEALLVLGRHDLDPQVRFRAPRPLISAAAAVLPLLIPVLLLASGVLSWWGAALVLVPFLGFATIRVAAAIADLATSKRLAERLLATHPARPLSPLAAWHAELLTSPRTRRRLESAARRLRQRIDRSNAPAAEQAVNLRVAGLLSRIETHLADLTRPVSPAAIVQLRSLLDRAGSRPQREQLDDLAVKLDALVGTL